MTELERIAAVVAEIGKRDDDIDTVVERPDGAWLVRRQDIEVELEFDERLQVLMLSAELGAPPEARRLEVFSALLSYALMWRETGGFRAGLSEESGPLWLLCDIGTSDLDPGTLAAVVADFAEKTSAWRAYVTQVEASQTPVFLPFESMIRV